MAERARLRQGGRVLCTQFLPPLQLRFLTANAVSLFSDNADTGAPCSPELPLNTKGPQAQAPYMLLMYHPSRFALLRGFGTFFIGSARNVRQSPRRQPPHVYHTRAARVLGSDIELGRTPGLFFIEGSCCALTIPPLVQPVSLPYVVPAASHLTLLFRGNVLHRAGWQFRRRSPFQTQPQQHTPSYTVGIEQSPMCQSTQGRVKAVESC
jgi:hypothetical protein